MKISFIIIAVLIAITAPAQNSKEDSTNFSMNKIATSKISLDRLAAQKTSRNLNHTGEISIKSNNKSIFEFLFPSIIALVVGLMAFGATLRSSKRQSNIINKQMDANKLAVEEQIKSSMIIAELDFRKTVLSSNRQAWINDLRIVISELISLVNACSLATDEMKEDDYRKMSFLITKAEFMLNPIKDKHHINSIIKLQDSIFQLSIRKKKYVDILEDIEVVKNYTKLTLKNEWERVKRGE